MFIKPILIILLTFICLFSQTINLTGTVSDTAGNPLQGTILNLKIAGLKDTTDSLGKFKLTNIVVNNSNLQISLFFSQPILKSGALYLSVNKLTKASIDIFTLNGKKTGISINQNLTQGNYNISINNLLPQNSATELYVIKLSLGNKTYSFKINSLNLTHQPNSHFKSQGIPKIKALTDTLIVKKLSYIIQTIPILNLSSSILIILKSDGSIIADTTQCFMSNATSQTVVVGKEVTSLAGLYKFCTNPIINSSGKASRIMLSLDASASMCTDLPACIGAMMNDPTNKRIDAANQFVDNVAANCPSCQIGVVRYVGSNTASGAVTAKQTPLPVNNAANINAIHSLINGSRCGHQVQPNIQDVAGLAKKNITFGGTALDTAVYMIDRNYDSLAAQQMDRHIIIMTDGDWQTPLPNDIYTEYKTNFPNRPFPIVHGVFLSDSARHVAAGYPPQGLGDCSLGKDYIDLSFLQAATQLSTRNSSPYNKAGMYFGGTTPQTIAGAFTTLFQQIIDTTTYELTSVTFINNTVSPPDSRTATIVQNTGANNQFTVEILPTFSLLNGTNTFFISYQIKVNPDVITQYYDTLTVIRGSGH